MPQRRGVLLVLSLSFITATACFSASSGQTDKQNETVWFALQEEPRRKLSVDPIGKIVGGKVFPVPTGCDAENPEYKKFEATYLQRGQVYSVSFGGVPAGIVGLQSPEPNFGDSLVEYDGFAKIHGRVKALATNAKIAREGPSHRRAPSQLERDLALQFAKESFAEKGIPAELLGRVKNENVTLTLLAPSRSPSLIGSFSLSVGGEEALVHYLFFIASENDGKLAPEFVWVKISEGETRNESLALIDYADLFGDGQDEVVAEVGYYENYRYQIYRRTKAGNGWERIFETEVLGCL